MTDRKTIQETLYSERSYGLPEAMYLWEFQNWLADLTKDVPVEFKDEVQIHFEYESDYDESYALLTIWYLRDETDEEFAKRAAAQAEGEARARAYNEQQERAIYEQLRRKFG